MQISPIGATSAIERYNAAQAQAQSQAQPKPQDPPAPAKPAALTPAPGLRPNVQDYVDIDRTLIALRRL